MTNRKQTTLNLTTSLMAFVINAGINFFLTPYLINQLGTESYGFIGLANDVVNYANILSMALNAMSSRFVSVEYHRGNKEKAEIYINSVIIANLILAGAVAIAGVFVVWKLEYLINIPEYLMFDVKLTFSLVFVNYLISIIIAILNCAPFIKNKMNLVYTRNMISYIIKLIVTIGLITVFDVRIYFISLTTLICTLYLAVVNTFIFKRLLPEVLISYKKFRWSAVKELLSSGIWMSLLSLSNMLLSGLNSLLTNRFISTVATGYLSVAKSIPAYLAQLGQQLGTTFAPRFTTLYSKGKIDELIAEIKQAIKIMGLIMIVPTAGFIIFGTDFYHLWMSKYDQEEIRVVQTVSVINTIPYVFNSLCYPLIQINSVVNKVRTPVIVTFITGMLNFLIILPFGFKGKLTLITLCIFSSVLMSARLVIFQPLYAAHTLKQKKGVFYKIIGKNWCVFIIALGVLYLLRKIFTITGWISFIFSIGVSGIICYAVVFLLLFNKSEYKSVINMIKRKIFKKKV